MLSCMTIIHGYTFGFHPQTQSLNHLVQHNRQHHGKVLLSSFHLSSHNRISSTDSKVSTTLHIIIDLRTTGKYRSVSVSFAFSHFRISSTDSKAKTTLNCITRQDQRKVLFSSFYLNSKTSKFRILSTDSEVITTLHVITDSTTGKYRSTAFVCFFTF